MNRSLTTIALATLAACGGGAGEAGRNDSTPREIAMPEAESTAAMNDRPVDTAATVAAPSATRPTSRPTPPPAPVPSRLGAGTVIAASAVDSITSRRNKAGEYMRVRITEGVQDPQGRTVIPAGAVVTLRIDQLAPAENDQDKTGKLKLTPTAVVIDDESRALTGVVDSVKYSIVGRGVTGGDAAKVGAGAAAGAAAGALIGGNTKSTVVGGVVGGAAGAVVASETNDRDVVIRPGNYVRIRLTAGFAR